MDHEHEDSGGEELGVPDKRPAFCFSTSSNESNTLFRASLANSYGGLPAIVLFNTLPLLVLMGGFLFVWFLLGRRLRGTMGRQDLNEKLKDNACNNLDFLHCPRKEDFAHHRIFTYGNNWFYMNRKELLKIYSSDSLSYLYFQRYIIVMLTIMTAGAMLVLLPVNIMGGKVTNLSSFPASTSDNVKESGNLLFVHVGFAASLMPVAMIVMGIFTRRVVVSHEFAVNSKVLWLQNLPEHMRSRNSIMDWLYDKYPLKSEHVKEIILTY